MIKAELDDSPLSGEMSAFLGEFEGLTDKITCIRERLDPAVKAKKRGRG